MTWIVLGKFPTGGDRVGTATIKSCVSSGRVRHEHEKNTKQKNLVSRMYCRMRFSSVPGRGASDGNSRSGGCRGTRLEDPPRGRCKSSGSGGGALCTITPRFTFPVGERKREEEGPSLVSSLSPLSFEMVGKRITLSWIRLRRRRQRCQYVGRVHVVQTRRC